MSEISLKTSIIDYSESYNGGVPVNISITIYDFSFESIYWIHPNGKYLLECEPNFLKLWMKSEDTIDLPFYEDLCKDIDSILPDKEEIFKEML